MGSGPRAAAYAYANPGPGIILMWLRFFGRPFETGIAVYVIINGIFTFFPQSAVKNSLENIIGEPGIVVPLFQILAGLLIVAGLGTGKANVESAGLTLVTSMFLIRAIALFSDNGVTLGDINSFVIAILIVAANGVRLIQIFTGHTTILQKTP